MMLAYLIQASLSQRLMVILLSLLLLGFGGRALLNLPIDAFPDISPTQVKIIIKAPGMTPEEVETRVIVPLEYELLGIPRQTVLRSAAKYAIADVTIDFEPGKPVVQALSLDQAGGAALMVLSQARVAPVTATNAELQAKRISEAGQRSGQADAAAYILELRRKADVEKNPAAFE